MKSRTILISGAGVSGTTLAYWLGRQGFQPTLVECAPALREDGYMIDFWGVGYEVAERMGLIPRLREVGYRVEALRFVNRRGKRVAGLEWSAFRRTLGDRFLSLLRGDLVRVLLDSVGAGVEVMFGDSVLALEQDDAGVQVTFERGQPRRFDLVVGADGVHSNVRRLAFGDHAQFERHLGYSTASLIAGGYPHRDETSYVSYGVPGKLVTRYTLRGDRCGFLLVVADAAEPAPAPTTTQARRALLRQHFGDAGWECPEILAAMDATPHLYFDVASQTHMDDWARGRVALVGDACACPSLLAGEGAAMAMAGAYLLAGELKQTDGDHHAAFQHYQRLYHPFVKRKQRAAVRIGSWLTPRTRLGLLLRNKTTPLLSVPVIADHTIADHYTLPTYACAGGM